MQKRDNSNPKKSPSLLVMIGEIQIKRLETRHGTFRKRLRNGKLVTVNAGILKCISV